MTSALMFRTLAQPGVRHRPAAVLRLGAAPRHVPHRRLGSRTSIVVETAVSLGERRSLVIVAVEGRRLLLGLATGGVSLLADLAPAKSEQGPS